jgi:acyl dehydratase
VTQVQGESGQSEKSDRSAEFEEATAFEIADADVEADRRAVGVDSASREEELLATATPEAVRNFARAYGDDNPLFTDAAYAATSRWGGQVAPQIMAGSLNAPLRCDKVPKELRGGSYRGIHAFVSGGTWEWFRHPRPGDTIHSFRGLESVDVKQSEFAGRSVVKVFRDVKMNQYADVLGIYRITLIMTERKKAREKGKYADLPEPSYTDEDMARIDAIYAAEPERVRGREPRYWEDATVGDELGPMVKGPLTTTDIIVFHAGGYGFVPYGLKTGRLGYQNRQRIAPFYVKDAHGIPDVAQRVHWDNDWSQAIGNPRAYDYGVLRECWVHHLLTDWMGDDGFVLRQHDEIRKFNYHGDTQFLSGEVTGKRVDGDRYVVDIDLRAINQRDEQTVRGEATIALPSREHGPVVLPAPPADVSRIAASMLARHGELLRQDRT